jgi:hypothetical protein
LARTHGQSRVVERHDRVHTPPLFAVRYWLSAD